MLGKAARSFAYSHVRSFARSFARSFGNLVARVLVLKLHGNGNRRTMCFASFGYPGCFDEPRVTRRLATFRVHNASTQPPNLCSLTRSSPIHPHIHPYIRPSIHPSILLEAGLPPTNYPLVSLPRLIRANLRRQVDRSPVRNRIATTIL